MKKLTAIKSEKIWGYELWTASTHPNGCQKDFLELCGKPYPLLVKVIQANESLSIQVHPDDEMAVELEGEGNVGKTECWYVLSADEGAKLVYGLKGKYSDEELASAIESATLEKYLNYVEVHAGDFYFFNLPSRCSRNTITKLVVAICNSESDIICAWFYSFLCSTY